MGSHIRKLVHAGQIAEVIDIPATMVGKLIGKAGETIKQLQYSTNTKVTVAHATETLKFTPHSCLVCMQQPSGGAQSFQRSDHACVLA